MGDDKDEMLAKEDLNHEKRIAYPDTLGRVVHEGAPGLTGRACLPQLLLALATWGAVTVDVGSD